MKELITRHTGNILIDLNQMDILQALKQLGSLSILQGQLIEDIALTTTAISVPHSLNRPVSGFIVVKKNANVDIWYNSASTADTSLFLPLDASGTVTASFWVF